MVMPWPAIDPIPSHRLLLDPLTMSAAEEMVSVLEDPELYEYTGGRAPTLEQLRTQYATQVAGRSEDGAQWWLNWVAGWRHSKEPGGYVQATAEDNHGTRVAEHGRVGSEAYDRRGLGSEAS